MEEKDADLSAIKHQLSGDWSRGKDGVLCVICEDRFQEILRPTKDLKQSFDLLDDMRVNKDCALCRFLVALYDSTGADAGSARVLCSVPNYGHFWGVDDNGLRLKWDLKAQYYDCDETNMRVYWGQEPLAEVRFSLDAESTPALGQLVDGIVDGQRLMHLGRSIDDVVSARFLLESYQLCQQVHGEECQKPIHVLVESETTDDIVDLSFIRVIDVQKKCLVSLPQASNFVALSYTWTSEPFDSLTSATLESFQVAEGIRPAKLPPTVAEAMLVVEMIKERYLWVDRMCIIQDSAADKQLQISQMGSIYRMATITIVSAGLSTGDRDCGLPGIRPGSRHTNQVCAQVRGLTFVKTLPGLSEGGSRWATRAWTYQENMLSKRHLVFTSERCAFFCRRDTFAEDYIRQACFHHANPPDHSRTCCKYRTPPPRGSHDFHEFAAPLYRQEGLNDTSFVSYSKMVEEYCSRDLRVESDILNGLSGLLRIMAKETGERFLCGLPMSRLLDRFLLWVHVGPSSRRGLAPSRQHFPSWSWAGWLGQVSYHGLVVQDSQDGLQSETARTYPYQVLIPNRNVSRTGTASHRGLQYSQVEPQDLPADILWSLDSCLLKFKVPCATAQLSSRLWGNFVSIGSKVMGTRARCNMIYVHDSFAGIVQRHITEEEELQLLQELQANEIQDRRAVETFEQATLLAMSRADEPWMVYHPNNGDFSDSSAYFTNRSGSNNRYLPFNVSDWYDRSPAMMNVLLVEWADGIATRKGVGQVHADAWEALDAKDVEVILE